MGSPPSLAHERGAREELVEPARSRRRAVPSDPRDARSIRRGDAQARGEARPYGRRDRRGAAKRSRKDRTSSGPRPATSLPHCGGPTSVAAGARCSFSALSSSPAWSSTATSTSRRASGRRGPAAPTRPRRPTPRREEHRRRFEGSVRRIRSTQSGATTPIRSAPILRGTRHRCATTWEARPQAVLEAVRARAGVRRHVRRRGALPRCARPDASLFETGVEAGVIVGVAGDADRVAPHGCLRLAAGNGGRKRPRDRGSRPQALRAARHLRRHVFERWQGARQGRTRVQRCCRVTRDASARHRP